MDRGALILSVLCLLLTPHTAVVRAQLLDAATVTTTTAGAIPLASAVPTTTTPDGSLDGVEGGAATTGPTTGPSGATAGTGILDTINAAGGDVGSVMDQFRAVQGAKNEAVAAAAANVTDKAVTGVDEAAVAAFLANFKANWGSGANLQALLDLSSTTTAKEAKDKASTLSATGRAAIALGIQAVTAGPFAVIGLIVVGVGLGAAITSLVAGILYAAGSAVGLYVSISVAIANQCVPADSEEDVISTGTTPVPEDTGAVDGGTGAAPSPAPPSSSTKNKKQPKPAVNCFDAQKNAGLINAVQKQANELNKYLIPYTLGSGMSDGLLRMAESVLESAVSVAKTVQTAS